MKGIFLDRDGVINELVYHQEQGVIDSPFTLKQFKFIPNVFRGLRRLNKLPLKIVIISNQPGMAKNHFDKDIFEKIDTKIPLVIQPAMNGKKVQINTNRLHGLQRYALKFLNNVLVIPPTHKIIGVR